jgi:mRNA degradation ribonuclease J1/J2
LPGNTGKILEYVEKTLGAIPSDIETFILTHYHLDHTGNAYELWDISGAKVAIHADDAGYVEGTKPMSVPGGFIGILYRVFKVFSGSNLCSRTSSSMTTTGLQARPAFTPPGTSYAATDIAASDSGVIRRG